MYNVYSYSQIPVVIDGQFLLATEARLANINNLEPAYIWGQSNPNEILPRDGVNSTFSLSYFPMYDDIIYNAMLNNSGITINFGNFSLVSGYVSNYSFQARAGNPIQSQAEVIFFRPIEGIFKPETLTRRRVNLNKPDSVVATDLPHADTTSFSQNMVNIPISFNYQYQSDLLPTYRIGEYTPSDIQITQRQITCNLEGDNLQKFVTLTGDIAVLSFTPRNLWNSQIFRTERENQVEFGAPQPQTYTCSGKITSFNLEANSNNFLKGNITVVQYL